MSDPQKPDQTLKITKDEFKSWFTLNNSGADTGSECKVVKYDLMTGNDQAAVAVSGDPMISFTDDVVSVVVDQVQLTSKSYYMRATTNGGVIAFKEIQVKQVADPCIYTVTPDKKQIIEPYVEGKSINVADIMKSSFVFGKGSD